MQRPMNRDVVAGLGLGLFGIVALALGWRYDAGIATEMGPGYMPRLLAGGIVVLGAIVLLKGFARSDVALPRLPLRPLIFILGGIAAFGLLIPRGGLIAATAAAVCLGKLASDELSWVAAALLAVFLSALSAGLFVQALGIPMQIFPG